MTVADIQGWSAALAPWVTLAATIWIGTRVQEVHKLVNSEMDAFRAALRELAESKEGAVFVAGQQNVRDSTRGTIAKAADATGKAADATGKAADAVIAAAGNIVSEPSP